MQRVQCLYSWEQDSRKTLKLGLKFERSNFAVEFKTSNYVQQ